VAAEIATILALVVALIPVLIPILVPDVRDNSSDPPPQPPTTSPTRAPVVTDMTDPCAFLDPDDLADGLETVTVVPDYGSVQGCLATIQGGGDENVTARVEFDVPLRSYETWPGIVDTINDLVIAREQCDPECRSTLQRSNGPRVRVAVDGGDGESLRQRVGERLRTNAIRLLQDGPLPDRPPFPERSVAQIPACSLLTTADLAASVRDLQSPGPTPGFADLSCAWGNPAPPTDTVIGIGYGRVSPDEIPADLKSIAGRDVDVIPRTEADGRQACTAYLIGPTFTARTGDPRVEIVELLVRGAGTRTAEQLCTYARALSEVVAPKLPK